MKKLLSTLTISLFVLMVAADAFAGAKAAEKVTEAEETDTNILRKNAGCGWGTNIWEGSNGLVSQACAVGSNHGLCGNQEFGILSNTAGCEKFEGLLGSNTPVGIFVAENMDNLAKDIARGKGEYLITLSVLLHISDADRAGFYNLMQSNFTNIYTSSDVTSDIVLKNIESTINQS